MNPIVSIATPTTGLDLKSLPFDMTDELTRQRWIKVHDREAQPQMFEFEQRVGRIIGKPVPPPPPGMPAVRRSIRRMLPSNTSTSGTVWSRHEQLQVDWHGRSGRNNYTGPDHRAVDFCSHERLRRGMT